VAIGAVLMLFGAIVAVVGYAVGGRHSPVYYAGFVPMFIGFVLLLRGARSLLNSRLFPAIDSAFDAAAKKPRQRVSAGGAGTGRPGRPG
jgi:ascorbate-specific PTS system EIIC-type component UlaA